MSISTYAELQTAIANQLDDTSLSARALEWITMAESRINRDLGQIRMAWTDTTLTGSIGSRSLALPTDFVEARALFMTTDGNQTELRPFIAGTIELVTSQNTPRAWSLNGSNIDLDCLCSAADTFSFRYRAKWALSDSVTTNWLLTNHPDIYFGASMARAYLYRDDTEHALVWNATYTLARDDLLENEARSLSIAPLTVDRALMPVGRGEFNYSTGQ